MEANLVVVGASVCLKLQLLNARMLLALPVDQGSELLSWIEVSTTIAFCLTRVRGIL